jgi:hypothetical protein
LSIITRVASRNLDGASSLARPGFPRPGDTIFENSDFSENGAVQCKAVGSLRSLASSRRDPLLAAEGRVAIACGSRLAAISSASSDVCTACDVHDACRPSNHVSINFTRLSRATTPLLEVSVDSGSLSRCHPWWPTLSSTNHKESCSLIGVSLLSPRSCVRRLNRRWVLAIGMRTHQGCASQDSPPPFLHGLRRPPPPPPLRRVTHTSG